jgi:Flp pilus assembly protein TadG
VTPIVLLVAVGVLQVVLVLSVRSTLASAAVEGARAAALSGSTTSAAVARIHELVQGTTAEGAITQVSANPRAVDGVPTMEAQIGYRLSLFGLLLPSEMTVTGHVLIEAPR